MPLYNRIPENLKEVDVIIAGGGTAACIVAGRLAAANPRLEILVIEYGKDNYGVPSVIYPALFPLNLVPGNQTAIFYECEGGESLNGRTHIIPTGGILGGGSSINFLMYTRAQRDDFDSWKTEGWGADDMLPFLKKLETYHGPGDKKQHGYDGPVHISDGGFRSHSTADDFLAAAEKVGYPTIVDLQDLDANNGFERWLRTISPEGVRQDTANTHLHPLLRDGNHPNLHVLTETQVLRVLIDSDGRASGVEFLTIPMEDRSLNEHGTSQTINARQMVVVSCGAVASPMVLERSGLGDPQVIKDKVEKVIVDLPGVGDNYQDHHLIFYPYKVKVDPGSTLAILKSEGGFEKAVADKSPLLGWNTVDVCSKIRPTEDDLSKMGPEFREAFDRDFRDHPNRPMMHSGLVNAYLGDTQGLDEGDCISCANYTSYPYSRGTVHIKKDEPGVPSMPHFVPGFFTDKDGIDVQMQIWAYKKQREIMRRTKMYRGELAIGHPKFPEGSKAACQLLPLDTDYQPEDITTDIEYSAEDDKAIDIWLRDNIETTWHSLGTAKMAPRDQKGVVDKNLSVYGVKGLKVVDLSIVPENVAANTCNTAMVVGEKGADIIAKELGFSLQERERASSCMIL